MSNPRSRPVGSVDTSTEKQSTTHIEKFPLHRDVSVLVTDHGLSTMSDLNEGAVISAVHDDGTQFRGH